MRPVRNRVWLLVVQVAAIGAMAVTPPPASAATPEVSFEEKAVLVAGATPGGSVVVYGVSQGFNGFTAYYLQEDELLVDADGDGAVRLELELPLTELRSVWAAVDLASGELTLATPKDAGPRDGLRPGAVVTTEGDGLTVPVQRWAYALWVRPGREADAGAWGAIVGDGGAADDDGEENRQVRASTSAFEPVEPAPEGEGRPPERLAGGDLVLVVDPETLAVSTARLPAE